LIVAAVDAVEFAAYRLGGAVLLGSLKLDNSAAWAAHGYLINQRDAGGSWSVLEKPEWRIRIGQKPDAAGCSIEYDGLENVAVYEEVLKRSLRRGYEFAHGSRKPAEEFFIMDTMASESGLIGLLSMMRVLIDSPTGFSMTVFLSQHTQH
jgi:hypothetical protein